MNNQDKTKQPNVVPSPIGPIEPQQPSFQKWLPLVIVVVFAVLVGGGILGYQYWRAPAQEPEPTPVAPVAPKPTPDETVDELSVTILSPRKGDVWVIGKTYQIQWDPASLAGETVGIILRDMSIPTASLSKIWQKEQILNIGIYDFTVLDFVPGDQYQIYISNKEGQKYSGLFSIISPSSEPVVPEPSITVLSPKAGEIWKIGDSKKIQWEASPSINRVKIVADTSFYSGIASVRIITQDVPNDGIFEWIVGTTIGPSPLNELSSSGIGEYRLRIEAHEKPIQSTEIPFSITFGDSVQIPSIEVLPLLENGKWIQGEKKLVLMNAGGQLQPRVANVELIDERENRVGTMNCKIDSIGKKVVQWDGSSLLNYCGAGTIGKDKEAIPGRYKIGWGDLESDYFLIVAP